MAQDGGSLRHTVLLVAVVLPVLLGTYTGLGRAGVQHRFVAADLHAVIMVFGVVGTLVALERAATLGQRWAALAPALSVVAVMVAPGARTAGAVLVVGAGVLTLAVHLASVQGQWQPPAVLLGLALLAWVAGAAAWLAGLGPVRPAPLFAVFAVLAVSAACIQESSVEPPVPKGDRAIVVGSSLIAGGGALAVVRPSIGLVGGGLGLIGLAVSLARHARRRGWFPRSDVEHFARTCRRLGHAWLGVAGTMWIAMGAGASGPLLRDAMIHALFLGFVTSMLMAWVAGPPSLRLPFTRLMWVPLTALHLSVAVRVAADLAGSVGWRETALHGNVAALVGFVVLAGWRGASRRSGWQQDDRRMARPVPVGR